MIARVVSRIIGGLDRRRAGRLAFVAACAGVLATLPPQAEGQDASVSGHVTVATAGKTADRSNVVITLKAIGEGVSGTRTAAPRVRARMLQRNKVFEPHLLVVPVGSVVEFPNLDPFFHNVFSLFDGKRFDLGLYEAGTTRSAPFTRPGVCYIFCNIHPEMSAVIVVVDTPYYAVSNAAGEFSIPAVPAGRYQMTVWHERYKPARAAEFPREVSVPALGAGTRTLPTIDLVDPGGALMPHKNKYGQDYVPPPPSSPIYK